jgi:hypothetical protein
MTLHSLALRAGKPVVVIVGAEHSAPTTLRAYLVGVMEEVQGPVVACKCLEDGRQYAVTIPVEARGQAVAWVGKHEVLTVTGGQDAQSGNAGQHQGD